MAIPVYSTRFILEHGATGPHSYLVPAGFVAIIRDVDVTTQPTGGCNILLVVDLALLWIVELGLEPQFTYQSWRGRQVVPGGGVMTLDTTDTADYAVSGYLLTSP